MPTREEMIAALSGGQEKKPTREEMIAKLKEETRQGDNVLDEKHPEFDTWEGSKSRFVFKNFSTNPEQGVKYLQKEHPNLEIKLDADNKVIAKKPDEKEWRKLDPSNFELQDLTDVAWDVPAGVAETAATIAGGFAGAPAGGLGAIPAAMAAGGFTGGTLEAGRQGVGKLLGVSEGVDGGRVLMSGALGAASPLLLGTGAGAKEAAKYVGKNYATKQAQEAAVRKLLETQRGAIGRSYSGAKQYIAPKMGEFMSGIGADRLKWANKNLDVIHAAEKSGTGRAEVFNEIEAKVKDGLQDQLDSTGAMLGKTRSSEGIVVDMGKAEAPIQDLLKEYGKKAEKSIAKYGDAAEKKVDYQNWLYLKEKLEPYLDGEGVRKGIEVKDYLDNINEITDIAKSVMIPNKKAKVDKDILRVARQVAANVDNQGSTSIEGALYKQFKERYSALKKTEQNIQTKWFKDPETTERTLSQLMSPNKRAKRLGISKALEDIGVKLDDAAMEAVNTATFVNPVWDTLSGLGVTSTSKTIPLSAAGGVAGYYLGGQYGEGHGGGTLGAGVGALLGGKLGGPAAMRKFMELNRAVGKGSNQLKNLPIPLRPQSQVNIWKNITDMNKEE